MSCLQFVKNTASAKHNKAKRDKARYACTGTKQTLNKDFMGGWVGGRKGGKEERSVCTYTGGYVKLPALCYLYNLSGPAPPIVLGM